MKGEMEGDYRQENWTEEVEDLLNENEIEKAVVVLEAVVSKLEKNLSLKPQSSQLATALEDLSKLYSRNGLSLKGDHTRERAFRIKQALESHQLPSKGELSAVEESRSSNSNIESTCSQITEHVCQQESSDLQKDALMQEGFPDDDWEAVADRAPDELLSPLNLPEVAKPLLEDAQVQGIKRRGRGTFSYGKYDIYSDERMDEPVTSGAEETTDYPSPAGKVTYGTRHVLVLSDFPLSTTTTDLEKLFKEFKDRGVVIRWLKDTLALAVFSSPSVALEAIRCITCPFTVRILDETDELVSSIPPRDLEPPVVRPKTSARAAQRMIAQELGVKLPSTTFGSEELRKQEADRKNRIVSRQRMKDDAWGDDAN